MSESDNVLKKYVNKKFRGAFNDFIDLLDTPTKYTQRNDIVVVNNESDGLIFKSPEELLADLITSNDLSRIKFFKANFGLINELLIQHNLNIEFPSYKIYDNTNSEIWPGDVEIIDNNTMKFTFQPSVSGKIVIFGFQ